MYSELNVFALFFKLQELSKLWSKYCTLRDVFPGLVLPRFVEAVDSFFTVAVKNEWDLICDECDWYLPTLIALDALSAAGVAGGADNEATLPNAEVSLDISLVFLLIIYPVIYNNITQITNLFLCIDYSCRHWCCFGASTTSFVPSSLVWRCPALSSLCKHTLKLFL
jgi:hypothetical protein